MCNLLWTLARKMMRVEIHVVVVGVVTGLIVGAFRLGKSTDEATAIGIATCFSVTVGMWLGFNLYLLVARGYTDWIATIIERIAAIESRILPMLVAIEQEDNAQPRSSIIVRLVAYSFYATPPCFVMFTSSIIMATLRTQIDYSGFMENFAWALGSLIVLVVAAAIQCLYLLRLQLMVASIERRLNRAGLVPPITLRADVLYSNVSRTDWLVRRFGGVGKSVSERPTA